MTFGHNCYDSNLGIGPDCAWPARLALLLKDAHSPKVTVSNIAQPSWGYKHWIESGKLQELGGADLVIIDLAVNTQNYLDAFAQMRHLDCLLHGILAGPDAPAVLFVETFRSCAFEDADCDFHCAPLEQGSMAVDIGSGGVKNYTWCNRWWTVQDIDRPVLRHYQLPMASYRDAVWPSLPSPNDHLPCFWNGLNHPDAFAHAVLARVVFFSFEQALRAVQNEPAGRACPKPEVKLFHQRLPVGVFCSQRKRALGESPVLSVRIPHAFRPVFSSGDWASREDVPGKLGWIGESFDKSVNHAVGFAVNFSADPRLEVSFLKTYERIGRVTMFLGRRGFSIERPEEAVASYVLDGMHEARHSIPQTVAFMHKAKGKKNQARVLPDEVGKGEYTLVFLLDMTAKHPKFKLLEIASC